MAVEQDLITTQTHDTRFYERINHLLALSSSWLSLANMGLLAVLVALVIMMPERSAYYITTQNGQIKQIIALSHRDVDARHLLDKGRR